MVKQPKELAKEFAHRLISGKVGDLIARTEIKGLGGWTDTDYRLYIGELMNEIREQISGFNLNLKYRRVVDAYELVAAEPVRIKRKRRKNIANSNYLTSNIDLADGRVCSAELLQFGDLILIKAQGKSFFAKRVEVKVA